MTDQHAIPRLLKEIERYLSGLDFKGKSDVQQGLTQARKRKQQSVNPTTSPVCVHLTSALAAMSDRALAQAIEAASLLLSWASYAPYPRSEIGAAFADGHGFSSLIGEGAFFHADDFDLGLFLIAPNVLYPDHHHAAPELYAPLTGPHGWRVLPEEKWKSIPADIPVWNEPWEPHATQTGDVPFLCIFCWTHDVNEPAKVIAGRGASESGS